PIVRLRLRQVQRAGRRARRCTSAQRWLPLSLQRVPHRSPVLRRRFHHDFLDVAFDEPLRQAAQLPWAGVELAPFKPPFAFYFYVRHHHRERLLVYIDSGDPIWHTRLPAGAENVPQLSYSGSRAVVRWTQWTPTVSLKCARSGSSNSTASKSPLARSTSPLAPAPFSQRAPLTFMPFRELLSARGNALLQLFAPVHGDAAESTVGRRFFVCRDMARLRLRRVCG